MARRPTIAKKRALIGVAALLLVTVALTGGWIWWTRPALRSAPWPEGTEPDQVMVQGGSLPSIRTTAGVISPAGMRSERHEWIASLRWTDLEHVEHIYELRLGESVDVEGLGRMTLVRVDPGPLIDTNRLTWVPGVEGKLGGGSRTYFVLDLQDDVRECRRHENNCPPDQSDEVTHRDITTIRHRPQ